MDLNERDSIHRVDEQATGVTLVKIKTSVEGRLLKLILVEIRVTSKMQMGVSSMVQIRVHSGIEFRQFIIGGWLGVVLATLW